MFFTGHSRTSEFYIPRYEFVYKNETVQKVLSGLSLATFDIDEEHLCLQSTLL